VYTICCILVTCFGLIWPSSGQQHTIYVKYCMQLYCVLPVLTVHISIWQPIYNWWINYSRLGLKLCTSSLKNFILLAWKWPHSFKTCCHRVAVLGCTWHLNHTGPEIRQDPILKFSSYRAVNTFSVYYNNTADGTLRDRTAIRLYQGVLYLQNLYNFTVHSWV
jgi:hypothetical protein